MARLNGRVAVVDGGLVSQETRGNKMEQWDGNDSQERFDS
jgi:hypothetical protein